MNRILRLSLFALLLLLMGACSRHKIIPDQKLAQIFHDAFLANAYLGNRNLTLDSLNVYEPIFASYGYTTNDVQYTIGNFSKRKSARLGDVVEQAIALLDKEGTFYNREVAVLDTINNVAMRTFTRQVYADSLIRVSSLRDTSRLSFRFDVEPGEYNVRLRYQIDSLDQNERGLKSVMWLEQRDSTHTNYSPSTLRRNYEETLTRRFTADSTHRRLRIDLLKFYEKPKRPSIWIRDFVVEYTPPARQAVETLYKQELGIRIFADEFFRAAIPTDSL